MELRIRYNNHIDLPCHAAFIRGKTAFEWLRIINSWPIKAGDLLCYIVGEKNDPTTAAGLLVIFNKGEVPQLSQHESAYTCLSNKLFIPTNAELIPALSDYELDILLFWDAQIFHPAHGFTGFDKEDRMLVKDLISFRSPLPSSWHFAVQASVSLLPLQSIRVLPTSLEEVFDNVKNTVNSKALKDIKKEDKKDRLPFLDPLRRVLLTGGLGVLRLLTASGGDSRNSGKQGVSSSNSGNSGSDGLTRAIANMKNWMKGKLEDLEKKRDSELKRLVDLFEKDMNEALAYAIPLSSHYENRGESAVSSQLSRRSTNFNLGGLGGGGHADVWNVDNYYESLRSRYLRAADQAIAAGDFKKAAYVYAHLLGDYFNAARVLRDGKFYREAAAIYRDHLKNTKEAAECLEKGGLLQEAIELYNELGRHEKSGDLHAMLNQKDAAARCYEKCILEASNNKDYLEVARLSKDKLYDTPRAEEALLTGWHDTKKPEICLKTYFDLVAEREHHHMDRVVQFIYEREITPSKKVSFLHVLADVNNSHPSETLKERSREIAYDVLSEQVVLGDASGLHLLKRFIPEDALVGGDVSRFVTNFNPLTTRPDPATHHNFALLKEVAWFRGMNWRGQLLMLGSTSSNFYLARANAYGMIEYEQWNVNTDGSFNELSLILDPLSKNLIVHSRLGLMAGKRLVVNRHFKDELLLHCPSWLPKPCIGIAVEAEEVVVLHNEARHTVLSRYSFEGVLKKRIDCSTMIPAEAFGGESHKAMMRFRNYHILGTSSAIVRIADDGQISLLQLKHNIDMMTIDLVTPQDLVVSTSVGCFLVDINGENIKVTSELFGTGKSLVDLKLIDGKLVLVGRIRVEVYTLANRTPVLRHHIDYKGKPLVAAMSADERNRMALLDERGIVSFHTMGLDE